METSGGGVVYHYTYTPNGNVADKLVNGSKALSYTYTGNGKVASITDKSGKKTTYGYDKVGRITTISENEKIIAKYNYYEDGNLEKISFANGIETKYTYDVAKNYKTIITKTADGEILLDYTYTYDGNGNRTGKTGATYVLKYVGNDSSIGTTNYGYDTLQRLQEVGYPTGQVEQYQYDNAGNRALRKYGAAENFKTGNHLEERYTYDNRNRLLERRNPEKVTYYQYDNQGNTVSELTKRFLETDNRTTQNGSITTVSGSVEKTELEQYKTYEYNSFNKTSKVTVEDYTKDKKEVHIQENFYDGENLRYGIEEDRKRTNFVTNGWSVFTELDAEWKPTKRLVRGYGIVASEELTIQSGNRANGIGLAETKEQTRNEYHFYHQNEHGDIEYITGNGGKVQNAYTYDAFGNITNAEELVKNRYTYNGEQYDNIISQYYLRARNYNPLVGRFTQEDVYRGDGLNLYAYCGHNPVMYIDPSGYEKIKCTTSGKKSGETSATAMGKKVHKEKADARRESGQYDSVNEKMKNSNGEVIMVPKTIAKKTGRISKKVQSSIPDAVLGPNKGGIIIDDKPLGRDIQKDYQELGRNVEAYKEKYGVDPKEIRIERYDPQTGEDVEVETYLPSDFTRNKK